MNPRSAAPEAAPRVDPAAPRKRARRASRVARLLGSVLAATTFAGCAVTAVKGDADKRVQEVKKGPEAAPFQSITGFSPALRCMDNMMIDYGVRDLSMLVEDILDQTKKVNAGTRDMLISAMSEMTRRSRAARVVAFGKDSSNVISFLDAAQRQSAYATIPQFDIKGSITQWDENVIRTQKDAGIGFLPYINLGASGDAAASVLGLDLSMLTTEDMSVLPGVTSRNSVVIFKQGKGIDGDAAYHKFGISFSMTFNKAEGQSQALRGLVELATIELMGKLTKVPYWKCLGADSASEEIKLEISDWYYAMATTPGNLVAYFQNQLRVRRFYDGPVDGNFNPAIDEAIANLRSQLGMTREPAIEQGLFASYLNADVRKITAPAQPARFAETAPPGKPVDSTASTGTVIHVTGTAEGASPAATASAPAVVASPAASSAAAGAQLYPLEPLALAISAGGRRNFARGEAVDLQIRSNRNAYVYCYLQDEQRKVARIYPNRWASNGYVTAGQTLSLPGDMRFQIVMNNRGVPETVACLATASDVSQQLPREIFGSDFEPLQVSSLEQVRRSFLQTTNGQFTQETFNVQPR
ncbi:MAG: DUF4384 domain-containing protein [Burkholderiaceae bacterium]